MGPTPISSNRGGQRSSGPPPSTSLGRCKREGVGRAARARTHAGPGVLGRSTPAPSVGCRGRGHNRSSVLKGRQGLEHSHAHWIVTGARGIVWTLLKEHLGHNIVIQLYLKKKKEHLESLLNPPESRQPTFKPLLPLSILPSSPFPSTREKAKVDS